MAGDVSIHQGKRAAARDGSARLAVSIRTSTDLDPFRWTVQGVDGDSC